MLAVLQGYQMIARAPEYEYRQVQRWNALGHLAWLVLLKSLRQRVAITFASCQVIVTINQIRCDRTRVAIDVLQARFNQAPWQDVFHQTIAARRAGNAKAN